MKILCKNSCVFENKHISFFSFFTLPLIWLLVCSAIGPVCGGELDSRFLASQDRSLGGLGAASALSSVGGLPTLLRTDVHHHQHQHTHVHQHLLPHMGPHPPPPTAMVPPTAPHTPSCRTCSCCCRSRRRRCCSGCGAVRSLFGPHSRGWTNFIAGGFIVL